jgi:lipopolysaccharide/colanic/teichoic acid biosynthesis glycosyltransferase
MSESPLALASARSNARIDAPTRNFSKRALDIFIATALLITVAPIWIVICLCIRSTSRGPVLFRQNRVGLRGKEFVLLKFRTMHLAPDDAQREYARRWIRAGESARYADGYFKLSNDARITPVGAFLRKYSLDELPQLINVVRGDMSLVGPRPGMPYEVDEYEPWQRERLETLPGMSGLWQVSGRNRLSFDEMVALDIQYVRAASFIVDLKILWRTISVVLRGTGL